MMWPPLGRGDVAAVLLAVALLIVAAAAFIWFPQGPLSHRGFGPDWDCTYPGKGDPVCLKRRGETPAAGSSERR